nr:protein sym-1 isoform X2 [Ziziphus jujuba var. spinosa]
MAANCSLPVARKSPLLYRFVRPTVLHSGQSTGLLFPPIPIQTRELRRSCSLCRSSSSLLNYGQGTAYKDFNCSGIEWGRLVRGRFLLSAAASDGGSAGAAGGGGYGGSGDGDNGSGSDGGENNWSLLSWYLALLARYPVSIKALTSAFLTLIGDLICQIWIDQAPSPDLKRTFLFTLLGLILVGPTLHFWYLYLSKLVKLPGASGAFLRLLLDQFLFSPIFIGVFLSTLMTLEGRASQIVPKLQQFQVLAANFVALIWNVILSFKAHREVLP